MGKALVPFASLTKQEWERLADAAALLTLAIVVVSASLAVFFLHTQDFRGYYAAARVALDGGDPYDYRQVTPVLIEITGFAGNNPFYYPPWFGLAMMPIAVLPYQVARGIWIVLNCAVLLLGLYLASDALEWHVRGWRRWMAWLSAFYLFGWVCLKFEQLGILMFLCLAWAAWAIVHGKDRQAGLAMALLCTKPNATFLALVLMSLYLLRRRRRVLVWMLVSLLILSIVGTLVLPGWLAHLSEPGFGAGLTRNLDGPDSTGGRRRLCTFLHWAESLHITGLWAWGGYALVGVAACWWMWTSARIRDDLGFAASVGGAVTLLLTPYALLYDYPMLTMAVLWFYREWPKLRNVYRWMSVAVYLFMVSVLLWARPEYDGYWLVLGTMALLAITDRGRGEPVGAVM
jgi:uncharacterized protein (TIGR03382 family)